MKKQLLQILHWVDDNILTVLTAILIVVIPLYPKIPLAELIQGYIVRLRLEDVLIFITFLIWVIQLLRRKARFPNNIISKFILIYLFIGFLSSLSAIFLIHTVPLIQAHLLKLSFHLFRRVEYFSLFFIAYSSILNKNHVRLFVRLTLFSLIGVVIYGIGQKYLYWPAFSTMNREFSKGILLYLQPNTRLLSTFGGHYDFAAYLMIMLCFTIPAAWLAKTKKLRILLYIVSLFAYWCLVLTTSRTSFIGYLVGITFIAILLSKSRGFWWSFKRWLIVGFISIMIMFTFSDLLERFTQVIPDKNTRETILAIQDTINQPFVNEPNNSRSISELPSLFALLFGKEKPTQVALTDQEKYQITGVISKSDVPPSGVKPTEEESLLPSDVTAESEAIRLQTALDNGSIYKGPSYSDNALKYGLSLGIRLDALWPQAIAGLKKNILLGSGYSTLVKVEVNEFTYAESTDNDYLRMLGETGILGAATFIMIIFYSFKLAGQAYQQKPLLSKIISIGLMGSIISLSINALYIDVFESSKIAYIFWIIIAIISRSVELETAHAKKT